MATIEQRLQAIEEKLNNSRITPQLPVLGTPTGNELVPVWSEGQSKLTQYPLSSIFASGSIDPTNDVVPEFVYVSGINYNSSTPVNEQISNIVNSNPAFTKPPNDFFIFYTLRLTPTNSGTFIYNIQREYYLFMAEKGDYGLNETQTTSNNFFFFSRINDDTQNSQTFDLGEIGTQDIHTYVNTNGTYNINPNSQIVVFFAERSGIEYQYLYLGQKTLIGVGETQTSANDFLELNNATPDPAPPIPEGVEEAPFSSLVYGRRNGAWNRLNQAIKLNEAVTLGEEVKGKYLVEIDASLDDLQVRLENEDDDYYFEGINNDSNAELEFTSSTGTIISNIADNIVRPNQYFKVVKKTGEQKYYLTIINTQPNAVKENIVIENGSAIIVKPSDYTIVVDSAANTSTIEMPSAASSEKRIIRLVIWNQQDLSISFIDEIGNTNTGLDVKGIILLQSNGTNWYKIN